MTTASPTNKRPIPKVIYLDNHATTPLDPAVLDAMLPYLQDNFGNPASSHAYGARALYAVDEARSQVAAAMQADEAEILFTSGATESNNFVIKGVFDHYRDQQPHFIVSNIEHKCVLEAAKHIEKQGAEITILDVNTDGLIEPEQLAAAIQPHTVLVSIMLANNEIGSINPVRRLAEICHKHGVLFHTDAAQAVGKIPLNVHELDIDFLSASGHKFYGPKGVGFAYVKQSAQDLLTPLLDGGGQEANLRSGTLNVPGIVGLGQAIELATGKLDTHFWHYAELRNQLYELLLEAYPDLILNGPAIDDLAALRSLGGISEVAVALKRLPHNLNVTLPSVDGTRLRRVHDVAFSSTSACSSGAAKPSYVLMAIGRTAEEAQASLRFGLGRFNTSEEVVAAAQSLITTLQPQAAGAQ